MPRFHFVRDSIVNASEEETIRLLGSEFFNPKETVILEEDIAGNIAWTEKGLNAEITAIDSSLNRIAIDVISDSECLLVLSDMYYPGWGVQVNGKATTIYRGNLLFRVVRIPEGASKVLFEYRPLSFIIGGIISLVGILMCLFLFLWQPPNNLGAL
jgi:uncharacterized membrane protein YfhO